MRTLIAFSKRRKELSELLASNNNLTFNRYFRLMAMACIEIMCTVPLGIYVVANLKVTYQYKGLADLHLGFDRVRQFPFEEWATDKGTVHSFEVNSWFYIALSLLFFILFGFAEEARRHYKSAYNSVAKTLGISTSMGSTTAAFTYVSALSLLLRYDC